MSSKDKNEDCCGDCIYFQPEDGGFVRVVDNYMLEASDDCGKCHFFPIVIKKSKDDYCAFCNLEVD